MLLDRHSHKNLVPISGPLNISSCRTPSERTSRSLQRRHCRRCQQVRYLEHINHSLLTIAAAPHLPMSINEFQCLVPLDTTAQKSTQYFGHPSWVYKTFSSEDGNPYVLRRVEGGRLSNDNDIRIIHARWRKVISANMVTVHNAWTTTKFGDNCMWQFLVSISRLTDE